MAEIEQLSFSYHEVVTSLIKERGLHEGVWQLVLNFGIGGANIGEGPQNLIPAAIIPVTSIGLVRVGAETSVSVDAAKVNPAPKKKVEPRRRP